MRKVIILLVLAAVLMVLAALRSSMPAKAVGNFKIGVIVTLSGPAADYGTAIRNGVELARREAPGQFAHLDIVYEDAPYDAKSTVNAFSKLRTFDKVNLTYVWGVVQCEAVAPLAERFALPLVVQCVQPEITKNRSYVTRFFSYSDQYTRRLIPLLRRHNIKRLALVLTDNAYLEEMRGALERSLGPEIPLTLIDRYGPAEMDFRASIAKIKSQGFAALAVFLAAGQISQFYKQLAQQEARLLTVGTNFFESSSEILASAGSMEGAYFANNLISEEFMARYRAAHGDESQITFAAFAYEFAKLAGAAFSGASDATPPAEIMNRLQSLRPGADSVVGAGPERRSETIGTYFDFPIVIKQIRGGRARTVP